MKLQDPRLEALLEAYRDDRRPSAAAREELWERLVEHQRPRRAWLRAAVVTAVAVAALVLLWLASRGSWGELARGGESGSGAQAPFGHDADRPRGTASAAGGRTKASNEASLMPSEPIVEPVPSEPSMRAAGDDLTEPVNERAPASGSRPAPTATPTRIESDPAPEPDAAIDDLALIEAAEAALRADAPTRALELLRQHEERFPSAPTAEERKALRVLALCAAGREAEGRGARWVFLREHSRSAYRERIEKACPTP